MEKSEKVLIDYVKGILSETIKDILDKEYPELKEIANNQKEINFKLENKLEELEKQLLDNKFSNQIQISGRCSGESRARSFEVYENVLDEFLEFCKTQPYTMKELVSQSFLEFISAHKKDNE